MNKIVIGSFCLIFGMLSIVAVAQVKSIDQKVDSVMSLMTLVEKIGQMNQYNDDWTATGPVTLDNTKAEQIRKGQLGSLLNCMGTKRVRSWQVIAMQSRMKIPLLFGQDVIHGYKTTFPIPLAEACSWDLDAMELSARTAATEASAGGINWTFAPMVDIARDPRWGRVMVGAGEDPYLGSLIATARVKGFQGNKLGDLNAIMACAKHFPGHGDVNVDSHFDLPVIKKSFAQLDSLELYPFKEIFKNGVDSTMIAHLYVPAIDSTLNTATSISKKTVTDLLRNKLGFQGLTFTDALDMQGVKKFFPNGEAAVQSLIAGNDMLCLPEDIPLAIQKIKDAINDGKLY